MNPSPNLTVSKTVFGIPRSHHHCELTNYEWPSAGVKKAVLGFLEKLASGERANLLFTGNPGLGKTHLAVALYRWGVYRWGSMKCSFHQVPSFVDSIKSGFNAEREQDTLLFRDAEDASALMVLDDILGRNLTAWELDNVLYRLINTAHSNGASMVITANHTIDQLATVLKPHEISRLLHNTVHVSFTGVDHRLK